MLRPLALALLLLAPPAVAQSPTDTTYGAIVGVTHDVLAIPLGVKRLDFNESEPIDFRNAEAASAAVETVWVYDGSFEGAPVAADVLPDTGSVARPLLDVRSRAFARALSTFQPHAIVRLSYPPFDRRVNDSSMTFLVGFRSNADRSNFMTTVAPLDGLRYVEPDRKAPGTDDL